MNLRRIVTGRNEAGKSVFVSDGAPPGDPRFEHIPGMEAAVAWRTGTRGAQEARGAMQGESSVLPGPGGTTLLVVTFPPDSVRMRPDFDHAAAGAESLRRLPGLAEAFEREAPGMHTTPTVDYGILLEGEISLELDGGVIKTLRAHDVVVQDGTRHAWRNVSDRPATMLFVLIGAHRG